MAHPLLAQTTHRPYPLPQRPWVMGQRWSQLLFAHWAVAPDVLRPLIPAGLELDRYDGRAWIGVVPFRMSNVRARGLAPIPGTGTFLELNVRTYVTHGNKPGVWFFSLDASNALAVWGARRFFSLPYFNARMRLEALGSAIQYESRRVHRGASSADLVARYNPISAPYTSQPGTLLYFLTERYCLYTADAQGRLYRGDIHHLPWSLQDAEAEIDVNTMAKAAGVILPDEPPLLHYADSIDVLAWYLEKI
jgi:uncharacterized protein